jgi:hypothetical protein
VGFEPTDPFESAVFKTATLNHSVTPPIEAGSKLLLRSGVVKRPRPRPSYRSASIPAYSSRIERRTSAAVRSAVSSSPRSRRTRCGDAHADVGIERATIAAVERIAQHADDRAAEEAMHDGAARHRVRFPVDPFVLHVRRRFRRQVLGKGHAGARCGEPHGSIVVRINGRAESGGRARPCRAGARGE